MALTDNILQYRGGNLNDSSGSKIGSIEEIYLDTETNQPEWALVNTGLFGTKSTFVPIRDASEAGGALQVPFSKDQVKGAPSVDAGGELSQQEEAELYRYYGIDYSETRSDTGLPEGGTAGTTGTTETTGTVETTQTTGESFTGAPPVGDDVSGPETDNAMTRSEEELRVGTRQTETGRVRLRKYVVSEPVQTSVNVEREEVRIEREPITDANVGQATSGPDLSEEEHEVTLRAEEPVVEKRVVPKERVRLDKDVVSEQRSVSADVRREEIEVQEVQGTDRTLASDADRLPVDSPLDSDRR